MKLPYLVQRVRRRKRLLTASGLDGVFEFDYMGSAEFEFGALPKARKAMVAVVDNLRLHQIRQSDVLLYFVGVDDHKKTAEEWVRADLEEDWRGKEPSELRAAFGKLSRVDRTFGWKPTPSETIGWWAVDQDPPWVCFKHEEHAQEWLRLLKERKSPRVAKKSAT